MIARVRGILIEKGPESAVIEASGVGYEVFLPAPALSALPALGHEVGLYTHFHVREDAQVLYGFPTPDERRVFLLLLTVKGVGPKVALGILSGLSGLALAAALLNRDSAVLTRIPGVGKKLAERLGLELSDKIESLGLGREVPGAETGGSALRSRALEALVALGYPQAQALRAVDVAFRALGKDASALEDIVKAALKAV